MRYVAPKKAPGLGAGTYSAILLVADEFGRVVYRGVKGSALEVLCKSSILDVTCSSKEGVDGCKEAQAEVLQRKPFGISSKVPKEPTAQEKELQKWANSKMAEDVELVGCCAARQRQAAWACSVTTCRSPGSSMALPTERRRHSAPSAPATGGMPSTGRSAAVRDQEGRRQEQAAPHPRQSSRRPDPQRVGTSGTQGCSLVVFRCRSIEGGGVPARVSTRRRPTRRV